MIKNTCSIRLVEESDLDQILIWRNDPAIRKYMLTDHIITKQEHESWYQKCKDDHSHCWLIAHEDTRTIGIAQITGIIENGAADWGFYVRPDSLPGDGTKLGNCVLRYAFTKLRLNKVCGKVMESNARSIAFHKKLGFTHEGILRKQVLLNGVRENLFCFGLLASEWPSSKLENADVKDYD